MADTRDSTDSRSSGDSASGGGGVNATTAAILARVEAAVLPIVKAHGVQLFDLSLRMEQGGWVLRVTLDGADGCSSAQQQQSDLPIDQAQEKQQRAGKPIGNPGCVVTLEQCADVSRDLSTALDVADLIPHAYTLEVSSPGLERPLRNLRDYERFCGHKAKLTLCKSQPSLGSVIRGQLAGVQGDQVLVTLQGGQQTAVGFADIKRANLVYELSTQPKKSNPKKKGRCTAQRRH